MLRGGTSYAEQAFTFYEDVKATDHNKGRTSIHFMSILGRAYEEFQLDLETTDKVPDATKELVTSGLVNLPNLVYPISASNPVPALQPAEISVLQVAASLMDVESNLLDDDEQKIRESIEGLRKVVSNTDLPDTARIALLEVIRLTRNALDQYSIYGSKGFREAFKQMLAELMDIYLREGTEVTESSWWRPTLQHIKLFDEIVAKLTKYKPMLKAATKFLGEMGGE